MKTRKLTASLLSMMLVSGSVIPAFIQATPVLAQSSSTLTQTSDLSNLKGTYTLGGNISLANTLTISDNVTIDLKGYTITAGQQLSTADTYGIQQSYIYVAKGASLTLTNSASTTATLTGSYSNEKGRLFFGLVTVAAGASFTSGSNISINVESSANSGKDDPKYVYGVLGLGSGTLNDTNGGSKLEINGTSITANPGVPVTLGYKQQGTDAGTTATACGGYASATITNATLDGSASEAGFQNSGQMYQSTVVLNNNKITGGSDYGVYLNGTGNATINGGTVEGGIGVLTTHMNVTITGNASITSTASTNVKESLPGTLSVNLRTCYGLAGGTGVTTIDGNPNYGIIYGTPGKITVNSATLVAPNSVPNGVVVYTTGDPKGQTGVNYGNSDSNVGQIIFDKAVTSYDPTAKPSNNAATGFTGFLNPSSTTNSLTKLANGQYSANSSYQNAMSSLQFGDSMQVYSGNTAVSNSNNVQFKATSSSTQIISIRGLPSSTLTIPSFSPALTVDGKMITGWQIDGTGTTYTAGQSVIISKNPTILIGVPAASTEQPDETEPDDTHPEFTPNSGTNAGVTDTGPGFTENGSTTKTDPTTNAQTTYTQNANGTKAAATQNSQGQVTSAVITIPSTAIVNGQVNVSLGTNSNTNTALFIAGNINSEDSAPELNIRLSSSASAAKVNVTVANGTMTPGTVAMVQNADGAWVPVPTSTTDGNVLSIPITGSTTVLVMNNAKTFSDTYGVPAYATNAAAYVSARDLMTGMGTVSPKPFAFDALLSRGQFATILYRLAGEPEGSGAYPEGITPGAWNANAARWAVQNGLMAQGGSKFDPEGSITREQLVAILYRMEDNPEVSLSILDKYSDADQIYPADFKPAMAWAVTMGIVGQDPNMKLDPGSPATRAQIAAIVQRSIQKLY